MLTKVSLEFEQAKAKHLLFKARLRSILYGIEVDEAPVLSPTDCSLGKWICDYLQKHFNHLPEVAELEKVHTDIHHTAVFLIKQYKEGKAEEARKGLLEMEVVAEKVVFLLEEIQKKIDPTAFPSQTKNHLEVTVTELNDLLKANQELDKRIKEQVAETVREKESFEFIAKVISDAVWDWDLEKKLIRWNDGFQSMFGFKKEEIEPGPESWYNRIHPEDKENVLKEIHRVIDNGGKQWSSEYRFHRSDGSYADILDRGYCLHDNQGKAYRMIGSMIDISERVQAENSIKLREARFREMTDLLPQIIWSTRPDGYHDYYNQQWYQFVGRSEEETKGDGWLFQFHPDDQERASNLWAHSIKTGDPYEIEYRLRYHDGTFKWVLGRALPMRNEKGEIVRWYGSCTDIQKQKDTEEALAKSEEQFRTFANNIQNLAWMANPDGWIYWYNQRWYDYTGTTFEEMQGWGWEKVNHPDFIEQVVEFVKGAWNKGETWELTIPLRGADGTFKWFLTRVHAIKDAEGKITRWIGTNTEIDDQKKAEASLEIKNKELIRTNNDLDNFIYTASHDLKAPVSNLEGLFNALVTEVKLQDDLQPLTKLIEASFKQFKNTLKDLTEITKVQKEDEEPLEVVALPEIMHEVLIGIKDQVEKYQAVVETDFQVGEFRFSRKNIRSILYNLISNGIKYSDPNRSPKIFVSTKIKSDCIVLSVEDNGLGIPLEHQNRIFKMFKRVHDHVEGTGIGLYIVKRIIDNFGGKIEVKSEVGKGSKFRILLPKNKVMV